jgi:hypothetical protein
MDDLDKSASFLGDATSRRSTSSLGSKGHLMNTRRGFQIIAMWLALGISASSHGESGDELRNRILTQTKVVVVTALTVPAHEYKGDGDPNNLEIVFLTDKADGPSRVSDDGKVIFLYKASEKTQQQLISRAFEIRIARASAGT